MFPRSKVEGSKHTVILGPDSVARRIPLEVVVDYDDFAEIVGVEILDFRSQLDGVAVEADFEVVGIPTVVLDSEMDAAYIRISVEPAKRQRSSVCDALVALSGQLVGIEIQG